jgi:hypothetical protein
MWFLANNYYYFFILALQGFCVLHCVKRGRQSGWIWLIVFLPLIGCLIYLYTEVFTRRGVQHVQSGVVNVLNPGNKIKKLETNLKFSDTFNNRVALADAYLASGQTLKATELYESSLTGNFVENEHVLSQLVIAYFQLKRYDEILPIAKKIQKLPQFARSRAHILYAMALEATGHPEQAETEFKSMKARFSNFEARYQYGCFLVRAGRKEEARQLLNEMTGEFTYLSAPEKRDNRQWFTLAKDELRKLQA